MEREIVVARYQERIQWVLASPYPVTVYNKGPALDIDVPNVDVVDLPNTGREAGTWLEHICQNYDDLADWTYFTQGSPHSPIGELWRRIKATYVDTTPLVAEYLPSFPAAAVKALDRVETIADFEVHWGLADHHGDRTPEQNREWLAVLWAQYFTCPKPEPWWFGYAAEYAVPRHRITDRPLDFWLWCRDLANRDGNQADQTPASAWGFEAIWAYLWGDASRYPVKQIPKMLTLVVPASQPCGGCGSKKGPIPVFRKT